MDENPYAPPQVELLQPEAPRPLPEWSAGQLRLLGWLSLVGFLGNLVLLLGVVSIGWFGIELPVAYTDWSGLSLVLLGCYVSLRFKVFAEARFAATGLTWPTWVVVVTSVLLQVMLMTVGAQLGSLGWEMVLYGSGLVLCGAGCIWLGVRLVKVPDTYASFRVVAGAILVTGVMLVSLLLAAFSSLPALVSVVATALVFFRGARELEGGH